jgi:hypothetical protein
MNHDLFQAVFTHWLFKMIDPMLKLETCTLHNASAKHFRTSRCRSWDLNLPKSHPNCNGPWKLSNLIIHDCYSIILGTMMHTIFFLNQPQALWIHPASASWKIPNTKQQMHCASSKTQLANLILQQNNYKDDGTIKLQIATLRLLKF